MTIHTMNYYSNSILGINCFGLKVIAQFHTDWPTDVCQAAAEADRHAFVYSIPNSNVKMKVALHYPTGFRSPSADILGTFSEKERTFQQKQEFHGVLQPNCKIACADSCTRTAGAKHPQSAQCCSLNLWMLFNKQRFYKPHVGFPSPRGSIGFSGGSLGWVQPFPGMFLPVFHPPSTPECLPQSPHAPATLCVYRFTTGSQGSSSGRTRMAQAFLPVLSPLWVAQTCFICNTHCWCWRTGVRQPMIRLPLLHKQMQEQP